MAVDITLDLPQILGRQRLSENPWKNEVEIYVKCIMPGNVKLKEEFQKLRETKCDATKKLLISYEDTRLEARDAVITRCDIFARQMHFKYDYVAVNRHSGNHKIPVENKLVQIAEDRAFDIQQIDYKDRFSVFRSVAEVFNSGNLSELDVNGSIDKFLIEYQKRTTTVERLKLMCSFNFPREEDRASAFLNYVPRSLRNYFYGLGSDEIKRLGYNVTRLKNELNKVYSNSDVLKNLILQDFVVDSKLPKSDIKFKLKEIYSSLSYDKTPKASDLSEWFEVKTCKVKSEETGKWENGFEILGIKS